MIEPVKVGDVWVLRSDGQPCGPRLRKSEPWPLRADRPFDYDDAWEAFQAAGLLQSYLANHLSKRK